MPDVRAILALNLGDSQERFPTLAVFASSNIIELMRGPLKRVKLKDLLCI